MKYGSLFVLLLFVWPWNSYGQVRGSSVVREPVSVREITAIHETVNQEPLDEDILELPEAPPAAPDLTLRKPHLVRWTVGVYFVHAPVVGFKPGVQLNYRVTYRWALTYSQVSTVTSGGLTLRLGTIH